MPIAAYTSYVWLLQVRPSAQVSTYAYVNPVVAVLLGILFAGERISWVQITGLAIILGSVLLINLVKYRSGSSKALVPANKAPLQKKIYMKKNYKSDAI